VKPTQGRPNIVWILSDQHRADALGFVSDGIVQTPHLDALAESSITFENAYCQGPLCVPARASLLTQRYVSDHGADDNYWAEGGSTMPTTVQSIRDAGYDTVALGKMHLYRYPPDVDDGREQMTAYGFTETHEVLGKYGNAMGRSAYTDHLSQQGELDAYRDFLNERNPHTRPQLSALGLAGVPHWSTDPAPMASVDHPDRWLGTQAAEWIARRPEETPFMLWVGFPGPHDPWDAPDEYTDLYKDTAIPDPTTTETPVRAEGRFGDLIAEVSDYGSSSTANAATVREVRRHYFAGVTMLDEAIGDILAALEARGRLDDTWIIYTSDHGEMLGDHGLFTKSLFYDGAVRIPLVIRPPGGVERQTVNLLVEHVDLAATLCSIAGATPVPESEGRELLNPVNFELNPVGREFVRSECLGFGMWRWSDCKLVVDEQTNEVAQFFDLKSDPLENINLVNSAPHAARIRRLMEDYVIPTLVESNHRPTRGQTERV
jgi:arylsulfatase